jgi:hypothetical protein
MKTSALEQASFSQEVAEMLAMPASFSPVLPCSWQISHPLSSDTSAGLLRSIATSPTKRYMISSVSLSFNRYQSLAAAFLTHRYSL